MNKVLGKKVVTIGGGHGGPVVLKGLFNYPVDLSAICSVFDSGGSTGLIRDEFGDALPSGDMRSCMEALSPHGKLTELLGHRFEGDGSSGPRIADHNLGNLILLGAQQRWGMIDGITTISKILQLRGKVFPVSTNIVHLFGELSDGSIIRSERNIDTRTLTDERLLQRVWLEPRAFICREAADAIINADMIVIGPGDLFTSLIPNLLVEGIADAISESNATVVYVVNLMTKWAETRDYTAADFAETLVQYDIGRDKLDVVLVNSSPKPSDLLRLYKDRERSIVPIVEGESILRRLNFVSHCVVSEDVLSKVGLKNNLIRHDPAKLGYCLMRILGEGKCQ